MFCVRLLVYFDDILDDHVLHLHEVFTVLKQEHLFANLGKCTFCTDHVLFLGFVVSSNGVQVDEESTVELSEVDFAAELGMTSGVWVLQLSMALSQRIDSTARQPKLWSGALSSTRQAVERRRRLPHVTKNAYRD